MSRVRTPKGTEVAVVVTLVVRPQVEVDAATPSILKVILGSTVAVTLTDSITAIFPVTSSVGV